jgi:ubiquinone/menaquinone biosynthesis C-methylase UbiE/uncharacterized protein YbaR (Trm112 family)
MVSEPKPGLLICPRCHAGSLAVGAPGGELRCAECDSGFPIRDGVIDLLPDHADEPGLAQRLMESDAMVRIYEGRLWRRSFVATLVFGISFDRERELVVDAAGVRPGDTVLDLACGPGNYARELARRIGGGTAVGLDISLPMLRYAARRASAAGIDNLILVRGSALDLPFPDRMFDAVNCCGALHLFPDAPKAVSEVARALRPGGRFTAAVVRESGAGSRRMRDIGVHAFRSGELEETLERAGFEAVKHLHGSARWLVVGARKAGG